MTPDGVKRESEIDRTQSVTHSTGRKLNVVIIAALSLVVGLFAFERFVLHQHEEPRTVTESFADKSIAVLPFANRSANEGDTYFVDGIHDDILTQLVRVSSIDKVISRTSVERYRDTELSIRDIAAELDVATIMEGSVQRAGDRVRITVQLIRADTDQHLWADNFDRELTTENVFEIQSEISRSIANSLQATLSPDELNDLSIVPTRSLTAYDAYLLGKQSLKSRIVDDLLQARDYFEQAVTIDPQFALAHVGLADSSNLIALWSGVEGKLERGSDEFWSLMAQAETSAERALVINPRLGEAYAALGYSHWQQGRARKAGSYEISETNFQQALALAPNSADAYRWYAQLVRDSQATGYRNAPGIAERAAVLDPGLVINHLMVGQIYEASGNLQKALESYDKALDVDPSFTPAAMRKGIALRTFGRFADSIAEFRKAYGNNELDERRLNTPTLIIQNYYLLEDREGFDLWADTIESTGQAMPVGLALATLFSSLDYADPANVIRALESYLAATGECERCVAEIAISHMAMDEPETLLAVLQQRTPQIFEPNFFVGHQHLVAPAAWAMIETGQQEAGQALLESGLDYVAELPVSEYIFGTRLSEVQMHLVAGDRERAVDAFVRVVDGGWRAHAYLAHPIYDPIREDPRFILAVEIIEDDLETQRQWLREQEASGAIPPPP